MKHPILLTTLVAAGTLMTGELLAVPAYTGKMTVRQADGTTLQVQMIGDEHAHLTLTPDGYPLWHNLNTGNYEYAHLEGTSLIPSGIAASTTLSPEAAAWMQQYGKSDIGTYLAGCKQQRQLSKARSKASDQWTTVRISDVPTTGTLPALVVLVNFSNKKFSMSDPVSYYDRFFHKKGFSDNGAQGSVADWYQAGSGGLYDPQFNVIGPVTVSGSYADYAGSDGTQYCYKLIQEVVQLLDKEVDFSLYDTDGNGTCDNIYCIYAGYSQADTGISSYIWPHSDELSNLWGMEEDMSIPVDGVRVDRYTVSSEMNGISNRPVGIGTFVHEFGHVLGLADHYNTQNSGSSNQPGDWDVMAKGCYNNDQNTPPLFNAFERFSLGWLLPVELNLAADTLIDLPILNESNMAYRVDVAGTTQEYFIIENRQQKGWDAYIPGHGALVWHIDQDQSVWDANSANYFVEHQRVDIVEANRLSSADGSAGDAFPGSYNVQDFTFKAWDKTETFGFVEVSETSKGVVQFRLDGTGYRLTAPKVTVSNISGTKAHVSWNSPYLAQDYDLWVREGEKLYLETATTQNSLELSPLQPETQYTIGLSCRHSKLTSDTVWTTFSTKALAVDEQSAIALPATHVTATGFTANWQAMSAANSYELTLCHLERSGVSEYGTGFDDCTESEIVLPEGWETNCTAAPNQQYFGTTPPAFKLNADQAYLYITAPDGMLMTQLKFWHRTNSSKNSLTILEQVKGQWQQVGDTIVSKSGTNYNEVLELHNAEAVKIVLNFKLGYVLLDDVYVTHPYDEYIQEKTIDVLSTSHTFNRLDADTRYAYRVRGKANGRYSGYSDYVLVGQTTALETITPDAPAATAYDLMGRKANASARGLLIVGGKKRIVY